MAMLRHYPAAGMAVKVYRATQPRFSPLLSSLQPEPDELYSHVGERQPEALAGPEALGLAPTPMQTAPPLLHAVIFACSWSPYLSLSRDSW